MATVEEIIVKFTGDAGGLSTAVDRARVKVKDFESEIVKANSLLEKLKQGTPLFSATENRLKSLVEQYSKARQKLEDEIRKAEKKNEGSSVSIAQRIGDSIRNRIQERFVNAGEKVVQQMIEDYSGLSAAVREYNKQVYESGVLHSDNMRLIGDQEKNLQRQVSYMKDPVTGRDDQFAQREAFSNEILKIEKQLKDARNSLSFFERELERNEAASPEGYKQLTRSQVRQIPMIGSVEQFQFEQDTKNIEEQRAKVEGLRNALAGVKDKIKEIDAGGGIGGRFNTALQFENNDIARQIRAIGKDPAQASIDEKRAELERMKKGMTPEQIQEANDRLTQQESLLKERNALLEKQEKIEKRIAEDKAIDTRLEEQKFRMAARGFRGVEAEVLARHAAGKERGNAELLRDADILAADAMRESLMTPFERGQKQLEELERIRGNMDSETYYRAVARIQKGMSGPGPAASRMATGFGSAEHIARISAYQRVLDEPQAMANNIERVNREKPPEGKGQSEANTYLRQIRDKITKTPAVELRPANLGG